MKKIILSAVVIAAILGTSACSNTSKSESNQQTENHNHEGHDHEGHDHAGHDHAGHDHSSHDSSTEAQQTTSTQNLAQGQPSAAIPLFTFYKVKSGISYSNQDLPKNKKNIFILFDPSCSHCRVEAAGLGKNYDKIKNVNILFVSMNDPALMATFLETFAKELVNKPNVEVLYDKNQDFIQKFHVPSQFPANYVYGVDNKLQASWEGDKDINDIIAAYTK